MALRKVAGPFLHKDLLGISRDASIDFWCDELDGFLASSHWRRTPSSTDSEVEWGRGILQMDGTFTPRRSLDYGSDDLAYYHLKRRRVAFYRPNPNYDFVFGADWFTLQPPYTPVGSEPLNLATDGVHIVDPFTRMFLPDRMIFLGYVAEGGFFTGTYTVKVFSLAYGAITAPVPEHTIQTTKENPGSTVWEEWRPQFSTTCKFMQSSTPERSVLIVRNHGDESKAVEYDYIAKKTVGWVRRLGTNLGLGGTTGMGGETTPQLVGYSTKHKLWAVQDYLNDGSFTHRRMTLFADEAVPFALSNPVALSPTARGEAVRYRVRLSGADNDPCIGHLVNWTCSAIGTVMIPQSTTDVNGYAETLVSFPPNADGPWEGTNISAEVIY